MGQKGIKGRYPIHWHMAKETDPEKTYAKDNAIHHVFQRAESFTSLMADLNQGIKIEISS